MPKPHTNPFFRLLVPVLFTLATMVLWDRFNWFEPSPRRLYGGHPSSSEDHFFGWAIIRFPGRTRLTAGLIEPYPYRLYGFEGDHFAIGIERRIWPRISATHTSFVIAISWQRIVPTATIVLVGIALYVALPRLDFNVSELSRRARILKAKRARIRCPICGYDLRATPLRCPECGELTAAGQRAARRKPKELPLMKTDGQT